MLTVADADRMASNGALIDEIVREGAQRMLAAAPDAEVNVYLAQLADQREERGPRLVVRNGYHAARTAATAAGPVPVESPRVNGRRTKVISGAGSRGAALAMAFDLIESARGRWRAVHAPHLVASVHAGARFECRTMVERARR
jgi:hypothetical protein